MMMGNKKNFTDEENRQIVESIRQAELETSGEIRVHLESRCFGDPVKKAIKIFEKIGMHRTQARNGVLIYLAIASKKFSIIGDKGIDEKVPSGFWNETVKKMQDCFMKGNFSEGLKAGIEDAGKKLKEFFPHQREKDKNELSNEISG